MTRFDSLEAWLNWQEQLHPRPIDLGLERVAAVYEWLELKTNNIPSITVGGTNGKGSCVAFLEAIYRAEGYKVGVYTSPHILRYNERIRINGQPVTDNAICEAFTRIDNLRGETSLSYFEFGTLAALVLFVAADVDVQLLEVGLGGRLDAVNIVQPNAAILTTVDIDHVDWLGHTREAIGREKAGIFRGGVPAIIGERQPPASVLHSIDEKQALLMQLGQQFDFKNQADGWDWQGLDRHFYNLPLPALKGEHQYMNASAALMAITALQADLPVSETAIHQGLLETHLPGRFQFIPGEIPVLLDVGHNPQAVKTLSDYLHDTFPAIKIHAVFAMMKDKDIPGVLAIIGEQINGWYLAPLKNPRAADENLLKSYFQQLQIDNVYGGFTDFSSAYTAARNNAQPGDLILIFGSFFLVSDYLSISQKR